MLKVFTFYQPLTFNAILQYTLSNIQYYIIVIIIYINYIIVNNIFH